MLALSPYHVCRVQEKLGNRPAMKRLLKIGTYLAPGAVCLVVCESRRWLGRAGALSLPRVSGTGGS